MSSVSDKLAAALSHTLNAVMGAVQVPLVNRRNEGGGLSSCSCLMLTN